MLGLCMRHAEVIKGSGVERLFASTFLKLLDRATEILSLIGNAREHDRNQRVSRNCSPRLCSEIVSGVTLCRVVNQYCGQIALRRSKVGKTLQDLPVSCFCSRRISVLGLDGSPRS